ncbi:MAG: restriction endonuclease subunit S [Candidatus Eisenbacteria bacterium]|nr:restriction endonuclease subunit S [Candidatus Eisenbacteria bacterium]
MSEHLQRNQTMRVRLVNPYPKYKPSGVDWLGEIPAHWEVKPLKFSVRMNPEVLPETTDPNYQFEYIDIGSVNSVGQLGDVTEMAFENAPSRARRLVAPGDTILSTVRTYLKAVALVEASEGDRVVSTGFAVLRPAKGIEPRFLWKLVQSEHFIQSTVAHSEGVGYPAISPSTLGRLSLCLPPKEEQLVIANFLDRETAKIDTLMAKIREGTERLKEYRTALISAAVTGKIDVRGDGQ